ncbi:MAG: POTRA domain-containing protein, partial [Alphaproteobacteria bacterium]
ATGLFADATIRREGGMLVVAIVENPVINRVAFEGNRRVESADLEREIQLRPRLVFTRTKVQQDVQRILDVYRLSGRFATDVQPKVIQLEQNRVDLVFEVDEGPLSRIRNLSFIGNRKFSDADLKDVVKTKEYAIWRVLATTDTYDPDRLSFDRELLRRFYLKNGYVDFKVVSAVAELTPDQEDFFVTFTVEEGERYKVGKIDLDVNFKRVDKEGLRALITMV